MRITPSWFWAPPTPALLRQTRKFPTVSSSSSDPISKQLYRLLSSSDPIQTTLSWSAGRLLRAPPGPPRLRAQPPGRPLLRPGQLLIRRLPILNHVPPHQDRRGIPLKRSPACNPSDGLGRGPLPLHENQSAGLLPGGGFGLSGGSEAAGATRGGADFAALAGGYRVCAPGQGVVHPGLCNQGKAMKEGTSRNFFVVHLGVPYSLRSQKIGTGEKLLDGADFSNLWCRVWM